MGKHSELANLKRNRLPSERHLTNQLFSDPSEIGYSLAGIPYNIHRTHLTLINRVPTVRSLQDSLNKKKKKKQFLGKLFRPIHHPERYQVLAGWNHDDFPSMIKGRVTEWH